MGVFKIKRIKADDLPSLPYDTKYLINSGFWFLYEISGGKKEENLQLLVHNALAYDQEGKAQKARTCAFLAQAYADADDKNLIDKFIKQLPQTQEISVQPWNENRLKLVQFVFPFMMLILIAGGIIIKRIHSFFFP